MRKGILELALFQVHEILGQIVLIHQHVILQILVAGNAMEIESVDMPPQVQRGIEHVPAVIAPVIIVWRSGFTRIPVHHAIGESVLAGVLVVCHIRKTEVVARAISHPETAACLITVIRLETRRLVLKEAITALIETRQPYGQFFAEFLIMGNLRQPPIVAAIAKSQVSAIRLQRISGKEAHQPSLCVKSIKRALWTSQHVYPIELIGVEIESGLAHDGHSVQIDAHRGAVDTASYSPHIH